MKVRINGRDESAGESSSIFDIVNAKGLVPEHIVVEHNMRIVPRAEWEGITLKENDSVEIVSFVGGG